MNISRIKKFQNFLKKKKIQYFMLNRTDEFLGEYIASYAERLNWLTNFSGSAGKAIISQSSVKLFVDGRYTVQAKEEINNKEIKLDHLKNYWKCVKQLGKKNEILSLDPKLHSVTEILKIKNLFNKSKLKVECLDYNPIDKIWKNKPKYPRSLIFNHDIKFSGISREKKIKKFQKFLKDKKIDYYFLSTLDSIAWMLNLRGNDIQYTPIFLSNLLIPAKGKLTLFTFHNNIEKKAKLQLKSYCNLESISNFEKIIKKILTGSIIGMDYSNTSFFNKILCEKYQLETKNILNPCIIYKAIKNKIEINGARKSNIRDGVSVTKFLFKLKKSNNLNKISEIEAGKILFNLRKNNQLFYTPSFETISAVAKHAALPHYRVTKHSNLKLQNNNIYLFDSGAQYRDGTTDITRTVILGEPRAEHKELFTRVLKGHISIASHTFPKGTTGTDIDYLARKSLKMAGYDFDHGTGHGIGSFLSVHEGPQRIAKKSSVKSVELLPGMILSNEPGYYKENDFGIRTENLIIVKKHNKNLIKFETISWAPIDRDLIHKKLLNNYEIKWINWYHSNVYKKLKNYLLSKEKKWLREVTKFL